MAILSNKFAIYISIGRLISMLAGFLMPILLVRLMTKDFYGQISQFLTLYTAIYTIAAMGIHSNLYFYYPSSSKDERDIIVSNTVFLLLVTSLLCGVILYIPPLKNLLFSGSNIAEYGNLIILTISLATMMNVVSPMNIVTKDKIGVLLFPSLISFGRLSVISLCAFFKLSLYETFQFLFYYQIFLFFFSVIYVLHNVNIKLDISILKQQLKYSIPFGLTVTLQLLSNYFDKFVCIKYLSPSDYAIYGIAFLSIPGISQVYDSMCQVNIINMSSAYRDGRFSEIKDLYGNFVKKILSFSVPVILIVSLFSEEIIEFLYTSQYLESAKYFRLYTLTFLTSMFGAGTILRSINKTYLSLLTFFVTCLIGIPLTFYLVSNFYASGAIVGAMFNIVFPRVMQLVLENRALNEKIDSFLPWSNISYIMLVSIMFLVPFYTVKIYFNLSIAVCIILSFLYLFFTYGVFLYKDLFVIEKRIAITHIQRFLFNTKKNGI